MTQPDDLQERIRQMEQEVYRSVRIEPPLKSADPAVQSGGINGLYQWINGLNGVAKVAAVVVLGLIAFAVISFILQLVWAAITLSVFAVIVYALYKIFFETTPTPLE
jgi:hypothetical protein